MPPRLRPLAPAALAAAALALLAGCGKEAPAAPATPTTTATTTATTTGGTTRTTGTTGTTARNDAPKVDIEEVVPGKGRTAEDGDALYVTYTGTLLDGKQFDSNAQEGKDPFTLVLGQGAVIQGWEQGLRGMKVGGKRRLTIPYQLAYGEEGQPPTIPPRATLKFDVTLHEVVKPGEQNTFESVDIKPGSGPTVAKDDTVTVTYTSKLVNGKPFDKTAKPVSFKVGAGKVLAAFEEGLVGMRQGGKRRVTVIPPSAGRGAMAGPMGDPTGGNVVIFEVDLQRVKKG